MGVLLENLSSILITVGLFVDIIGVWVLALDVLSIYQGPRYEHERSIEHMLSHGLPETIDGGVPEETPEYVEHQKKTLVLRKRGLFILTIGFALQIVGVWSN